MKISFLAKSLLKKKLSMFSATLWIQMRSSIKIVENWGKQTNKQTKPYFIFFLLVPFNFYPSSVNRGVSREPKLNKRSEVFNHLHQHGNDSASTSTSHDKVEVARWMCSCQLPLVWNKIILNQNRWHIMLLFLKGSPNSYKDEKPRKDLASWGFHLPSHAIICTI